MKASWTRELDLAVRCVVRESATSVVGPRDILRVANSYSDVVQLGRQASRSTKPTFLPNYYLKALSEIIIIRV